jgi:site-specific DNA-methyltransferase (adenine-specific)
MEINPAGITPGPDSRRRTETSSFGVSRRVSHDASAFYARFTPPAISDDDTVTAVPTEVLEDACRVGDSRNMTIIPDNSVALVVTSPPYFVGKEYETAVTGDPNTRASAGSTPTSYFEYLEMLRDVFAECVRVLEPGGRIAVNVANLGRKPYRSLSADVISILQDDLGLLLRGEIIWHKADGATGSLAWGSYRSAANPVLRDLTERVVVASKGRFDRAKPKSRATEGLPHESTLSADDFMEATLDVWRIDAESARRVQHPAPFPIELPRRLIDLYTYKGDVVLDPFLGSGTTVVAAERTGRKGIGFDLDPEYVAVARKRLETERERRFLRPVVVAGEDPLPLELPDSPEARIEHFQARATQEGKKAHDLARVVLEDCGFEIIEDKPKVKGAGVQFDFLVASRGGRRWYVDVSGAFTTVRPGLMRTDTLWKALGRIHVVKQLHDDGQDRAEIIIITSNLPKPGSEGQVALRAAGPSSVFDAIEMFDDRNGVARLRSYAGYEDSMPPVAGFWSQSDIDDRYLKI